MRSCRTVTPDALWKEEESLREVRRIQARVGDWLIVEGRRDSEHRREAEVLEVRGENGAPPYLVHWKDGHEGLVYPGGDSHLRHAD